MTFPKRSSAALVLVAVLAIALLWLWRVNPRRPDGGPIIIYVVDTLRPDRMSLYGANRSTTPAAEALAADAAIYVNAFAVSTWTRPSIATLLTSLLPAEAGTLNRWGVLRESAWYLPHALQQRGWATAGFVGNGNLFDDRVGFGRGFDTFRPVIHRATGDWHPTAREVVDPAIEFIEAQSSSAFFLYLHVVDPHMPYVLEPSYRGLFTGDDDGSRIPVDYDRGARQADDQFQRLADSLRRRGFWDSATVVYTADHGEEFGEHGGASHGTSLYDEQLRVPLIVKYPDGDGRGTLRRDPVTLADVTPTLAELHGIPARQEWAGTSLWKRTLPADRTLYFTEDLDNHRMYGIRRGQTKVVVQLYPAFSQTVYFLGRDPDEQSGVTVGCGTAAPVEDDLMQSLAAWRERDVAAYPSLRVDLGSSRSCQASVDLAGIEKPFLTAEQHCRWAARIAGHRLILKAELTRGPEELYVSANDTGRYPELDSEPGVRRCPAKQVKAHLLQGPVSEEYLRQLKALGYLQGS
jgi:arylsulfatase A-like enzyme